MASSPKIVDDSSGSLEIENYGSFKAAKELLGYGVRVFILSTGSNRRLGVPEETFSAVSSQGASVEVYSTEEVINRYAELADNQPVGGLTHSTC